MPADTSVQSDHCLHHHHHHWEVSPGSRAGAVFTLTPPKRRNFSKTNLQTLPQRTAEKLRKGNDNRLTYHEGCEETLALLVRIMWGCSCQPGPSPHTGPVRGTQPFPASEPLQSLPVFLTVQGRPSWAPTCVIPTWVKINRREQGRGLFFSPSCWKQKPSVNSRRAWPCVINLIFYSTVCK